MVSHVCDANCPQWVSSKICSHAVAVAEIDSSLRSFLDWSIACAVQPNRTTLSMSGMPSGRGKKKNQIRSQRKGKQRAASPETLVASPMSLVANVAQSPTSVTRSTHFAFCSTTALSYPLPVSISSTANFHCTAQSSLLVY